MCQHMRLESASLIEIQLTHFTLQQSDNICGFKLLVNVTVSLHTFNTFMWFLIRVCQLMPVQLTSLCECLFAYVTFMWVITSVCHHMLFQMSSLCEYFLTYITFMWFITSVCQHAVSDDQPV